MDLKKECYYQEQINDSYHYGHCIDIDHAIILAKEYANYKLDLVAEEADSYYLDKDAVLNFKDVI